MDPLDFASVSWAVFSFKYNRIKLLTIRLAGLKIKVNLKHQAKVFFLFFPSSCELLPVSVAVWFSKCHSSLSAFEAKASWQMSLPVIQIPPPSLDQHIVHINRLPFHSPLIIEHPPHIPLLVFEGVGALRDKSDLT